MKKTLFIPILLTLSFFFFSCQKTELASTPDGSSSGSQLKQTGPGTGDQGIVTGRNGGPGCEPTTVALLAGQTLNAGDVTVSNDADFIYVTYTTANDYVLTQTHLYVGDCALIPVNNAGNPLPGHFPFVSVHHNVTSYTYQVPISVIGLGNCGCIAAHSVVVKLDAAGNVIDTQTAWGEGTRINPNGGNWGMKFDYCPCVQ